MTAQRVGAELGLVRARPPAFRLFDVGVGDATVLSLVMRRMQSVVKKRFRALMELQSRRKLRR